MGPHPKALFRQRFFLGYLVRRRVFWALHPSLRNLPIAPIFSQSLLRKTSPQNPKIHTSTRYQITMKFYQKRTNTIRPFQSWQIQYLIIFLLLSQLATKKERYYAFPIYQIVISLCHTTHTQKSYQTVDSTHNLFLDTEKLKHQYFPIFLIYNLIDSWKICEYLLF